MNFKKIILSSKNIWRYYNAKKTSHFVKKYYKENKYKGIDYSKNIWNDNVYWDFYFQSLPHSINSSYFVPYDYFVYKIEPFLNESRTNIYANDKNMYDKVFSNVGVKLPKTFFRCMNNILMDDEYDNIYDINSFFKKISEDIIIKKGRDTQGGKGIEKYTKVDGKFINVDNGIPISIDNLKNIHNGNFVVQEIIKQHPFLGKFHLYSLNTIRVQSYRSVKTNKVSILMAIIRMGVGKSYVDNVSSGGISVGLKIDSNNHATLREFSFDKWGNYCKTHPDTKIKFKDSQIPNFHLIVESVEKLSNSVPYQRIIGWDFTINEFGEPVLIELNTGSGIWGLQRDNGLPLFGDFTFEIIDYLKKTNRNA